MQKHHLPQNTQPHRAAHFKETRLQRFQEIAEDYTEMIAEMIAARGKARVCDLARQMGISHVAVLKSIKKLIRDGYLIKNENQEIELTPKGEELGAFSKKKHEILTAFLLHIGVPEKIVPIDVEGLEHHLSKETLQALENFLKNPHPY
jgi:DtxR family manganese transport transcriptional regulator